MFSSNAHRTNPAAFTFRSVLVLLLFGSTAMADKLDDFRDAVNTCID